MSSADQVGWGGRTSTPPNTPSPQLGSGYLPDNNFVHACYFRSLSFQDVSRQDHEPSYDEIFTLNDKPDCVDVKYYEDVGAEIGHAIQFGGPGGLCGNWS